MLKMKHQIKKVTPIDLPIILLMDNIHIYKDKSKHLRIFKQITPSMWNFTGQALIIPELSHDTKALLQ